MDSIRGLTDAAWRTDRKTLLELYTIWFESGNMDIIKELDEGLYDLVDRSHAGRIGRRIEERMKNEL